jgi:asparagine synthase
MGGSRRKCSPGAPTAVDPGLVAARPPADAFGLGSAGHRVARKLIGRARLAVAPTTWDRLLAAVVSNRHVGDQVHRLGRVLANDNAGDLSSSFMSIWDRPSAVVFGTTDLTERTTALAPCANDPDEKHRMMLLDARTYLPDDILVQVDRASIGVGLEARVPFLDRRVAQFCWRLDESQGQSAKGFAEELGSRSAGCREASSGGIPERG